MSFADGKTARYSEPAGVVQMPAETDPPAEKPKPRRKSPGKSGCDQCRAAGGCCSRHVGYYEEVDVLKSAGIAPASRERGTWDADVYRTSGITEVS